MTLKEKIKQQFKTKDDRFIKLKDFLKEGDWWEIKKRNSVATVILHDAVKRIADEAGISRNVDYTLLQGPDSSDRLRYVMQAKITNNGKDFTVELGETNKDNLSNRGRANPANMAQKRAYDRAVFRHLEITGILSEEEIVEDNNQKKEMNKLTYEEQQVLAPIINVILLSKTKKDLETFRVRMRAEASKYPANQLQVLRGLWLEQFKKVQKTF